MEYQMKSKLVSETFPSTMVHISLMCWSLVVVRHAHAQVAILKLGRLVAGVMGLPTLRA